MSDRAQNSAASEQPLFQNMDEQEQAYAPHQVPGELDARQTTDPDPAAIPSTSLTTPELTIAAPASIAERREADDASRDEA